MRKMNKNIQDKFEYPVSLFFPDQTEFLIYEDESTMQYSNFDGYDPNFNSQTKIYDKNGKSIAWESKEVEVTALFGIIKSKSEQLTLKYFVPEIIDAEGFKHALIKFLEKQKEPVVDRKEIGMEGLTRDSSLDEILDRAIDYAVAYD